MGKQSNNIADIFSVDAPFAITMWDFSWIERRWPGAGYEDWDQVLTELTERGYQVVRIDAFPHLMAADADKEWTLKPVWNTQDWGSRSINRITLSDAFRDFLQACRRHGVRVGLSTWFREDVDNIRMKIHSPQLLAEIWIKTLEYIEQWGELDNILYVDMCNEFPHPNWSPFFYREGETDIDAERACKWMREAAAELKKVYPQMPVGFSFASPFYGMDRDLSFLDFLEPHVWMTNSSDFYEKVGYHYEQFDDIGYTNLALRGEQIYRSNRNYYIERLLAEIEKVADWSKRSGKPLITTECWAVVDYKDWPLLNWDWILELNAIGVKAAAATGRWAGMATSNFCGPQFHGMWREKEWHQKMTEIIRQSGKSLLS